jgi:hypothetical protein
MECYHGVLSFDHKISGSLTINEIEVNFDDGKGYLEKDWGTSIPSSWIWMQTNQFQGDVASLFGSVAKIPRLKNYFTVTSSVSCMVVIYTTSTLILGLK